MPAISVEAIHGAGRSRLILRLKEGGYSYFGCGQMHCFCVSVDFIALCRKIPCISLPVHLLLPYSLPAINLFALPWVPLMLHIAFFPSLHPLLKSPLHSSPATSLHGAATPPTHFTLHTRHTHCISAAAASAACSVSAHPLADYGSRTRSAAGECQRLR